MSTENVVVVVHGKAVIDPKDHAPFVAAYQPVFDKLAAMADCVYILMGEDPENPGTFRWTEGWTKDMPWLQENVISQDWFSEPMKVVGSFFVVPPVLEIFRPVQSMSHIAKGKS